VITLEEATAEKALRDCCQGFSRSVVGVWQGQPVSYGLLGEHAVPDVSEEDISAMGWDQCLKPTAVAPALQAVGEKSDRIRHQQIAYAGWLTFLGPYQSELQALRHRWNTLDVKLSWPF
jgi:hypothetical protein